MTFSKSQYIRGLQCHKSLWLYKNRPELRTAPDAAQESLFETGYQVGELAKTQFPGGVEVALDADDFNGMIDKTKALISNGMEVIYEATFKEDGVFAMVDILMRNGNAWDVYEVKASTSVKPYHLNDISIQWYALSKAIPLNRAYVVHINSRYVRKGELSIRELLKREDVTDTILERQAAIPEKLAEIETMLRGDMPDIDIGKHCLDPFECDFRSECWKHIPKENSVFDLSYAGGKQWRLIENGIYTIDAIPEDMHFGANASVQIAHHRSGETKIERKMIEKFLDTIVYPINFFDFETFQEAVPRFDDQRPYQQMPFQYSLHILHKDGTLEHKEFLGDENEDPRKPLIEQMIEDITSTGSIVAFNQSFEITRIKELAEYYPQKEKELLALVGRFVDLAHPFQHKHYYHPGFKGGYSIKVVLPTLFPDDDELDYKKLGSVQNGGDAMDTFARLHLLSDKSERDAIRKDLLAYCRLDTLAMEKIREKLEKIVGIPI